MTRHSFTIHQCASLVVACVLLSMQIVPTLVVTAFTTTPPYGSHVNQRGPRFSVAENPVVLEGKETETTNGVSRPLSDSKGESTATTSIGKTEINDEEYLTNIFDIVSARAALCLYESELRRNAKINQVTTPSSATNWIDDATAFALQKSIDKLKIKV